MYSDDEANGTLNDIYSTLVVVCEVLNAILIEIREEKAHKRAEERAEELAEVRVPRRK